MKIFRNISGGKWSKTSFLNNKKNNVTRLQKMSTDAGVGNGSMTLFEELKLS